MTIPDDEDPPSPRMRYWETTITLTGLVEAQNATEAFLALRRMAGLPVETGGYVSSCATREVFPEPAKARPGPLLALD